jgi:hypothetical protein
LFRSRRGGESEVGDELDGRLAEPAINEVFVRPCDIDDVAYDPCVAQSEGTVLGSLSGDRRFQDVTAPSCLSAQRYNSEMERGSVPYDLDEELKGLDSLDLARLREELRLEQAKEGELVRCGGDEGSARVCVGRCGWGGLGRGETRAGLGGCESCLHRGEGRGSGDSSWRCGWQ